MTFVMPGGAPNRSASARVQPPVHGGGTARAAIAFRDHRAFWAGVTAITGGVALHLPMYFGAGEMDYGIETRRRALEEITAVELREVLEVQ
jgi:hypothetical protein